MHLVGFIIRIYHDARSPERQLQRDLYCTASDRYINILREFEVLRTVNIFGIRNTHCVALYAPDEVSGQFTAHQMP